MNKNYYKILNTTTGLTFNLPLFLEADLDEMGVMVGFDGDIEQVEQLCNFSYTGTTGNTTLTVYSTTNPDRLRQIVEQTYTIDWGDGNTSGLTINAGVSGTNLPSVSHTYSVPSGYTVTITLAAPWVTQKLSKKVVVPFNFGVDSYLGTFT
jgi:hypothetical protein